jgi:hypothetical protein
MIANATRYADRTRVWSILDELKPTDVITRNQPGVDTFAHEWATHHHVRLVRMPLSSLPKHLLAQDPDLIVDFGSREDPTLRTTVKLAKQKGIKILPISY